MNLSAFEVVEVAVAGDGVGGAADDEDNNMDSRASASAMRVEKGGGRK